MRSEAPVRLRDPREVHLAILLFAAGFSASSFAQAEREESPELPETFSDIDDEVMDVSDATDADAPEPDTNERSASKGQEEEVEGAGLVSGVDPPPPVNVARAESSSYLDLYAVALAVIAVSWAVELVVHLLNGAIFFGLFPPASVPIIGLAQLWVAGSACLVVPGAQALAIHVVGALLDERPIFAGPAPLCWTTFASYASCAVMSCVGVGAVLVAGAIIAALLSATSSPVFYVAAPAVSLIVATCIAFFQPFVPVTVFLVTRQRVTRMSVPELSLAAARPNAQIAY